MHPKPSPFERSSVTTAGKRACGPLLKPAILVCCWLSSSLQGAFAQGPVDFRRDVLPILSENCFTCHGPDVKTRKADLRLDVKESALRTKEPGHRAGQERRKRALRAHLEHRPRRGHAAAEIGQEAGAFADRRPQEMDRSGRELEGALGVRADRPAGTAAGSQRELDQKPDRPIRPGRSRGQGALAIARGRP